MRRALIVDDEPSVLLTLRAILQLQGLEVETAGSGKAAKVFLHEGRFDLVITDLSMETERAGYEVVQAAKDQAGKPSTLVISAFPDLLTDWKKYGADAMLAKPTDTSELIATVAALLERQANQCSSTLQDG